MVFKLRSEEVVEELNVFIELTRRRQRFIGSLMVGLRTLTVILRSLNCLTSYCAYNNRVGDTSFVIDLKSGRLVQFLMSSCNVA